IIQDSQKNTIWTVDTKDFYCRSLFLFNINIFGTLFLIFITIQRIVQIFLGPRIYMYKACQSIDNFDNETIYIFNITDSELLNQNESYLSMKFTFNKTLLYMSNEFQQKYNFTVETHLVEIQYYTKGFNAFLCLASDLETMFIIDFLDFLGSNYDGDVQLLNQNTNETWSWNKQQLQRKYVVAYDERIYTTLTEFIKCILGIFLQSIIASIYMKMSIICAPILIIYMSICYKQPKSELHANLLELRYLSTSLN
ncbi:unnamed protein product, partial (macronuclear) [Paramecium tetraurelia]